MTVTAVRKHPGALTMAIEFDASVERVWQVWADPRQLERWWGPPTNPATCARHHLALGGRAEYHMTGPKGGHMAATGKSSRSTATSARLQRRVANADVGRSGRQPDLDGVEYEAQVRGIDHTHRSAVGQHDRSLR
jgi:Activator of Hsp90 ATPase homolog 1-like protein